MKSMFLLAIVTVFSLAAFAAGGKSVSYKSGEETVQAMLYTPAGKGPFPGIVVIHEWWGLNDWVKEQAWRTKATLLWVLISIAESWRLHPIWRMNSCVGLRRTARLAICTLPSSFSSHKRT